MYKKFQYTITSHRPYMTLKVFRNNNIFEFFYTKIDLKTLKTTFLWTTRRALSNQTKKWQKKILWKFRLAGTLYIHANLSMWM